MKETKALAGMLALLLAVSLAACGRPASQETDASGPADTAADLFRSVTVGTEEYRGFLMDNVPGRNGNS